MKNIWQKKSRTFHQKWLLMEGVEGVDIIELKKNSNKFFCLHLI
jgi:hypothetical protein